MFPAEPVSECCEYFVRCCLQYIKQGPHAGGRNRPHPLVLANTEYSFDTGSVVSALDDQVALRSERCREKTGPVNIFDFAKDYVTRRHCWFFDWRCFRVAN